MLEVAGATAAQAQEIVEILGRRLSPDEMHVWVAHPENSHSIPNPGAAKEYEAKGLIPADMNWTPINTVSAGKTKLVIDEARRHVRRITGRPVTSGKSERLIRSTLASSRPVSIDS
jgi:hypothetical protein